MTEPAEITQKIKDIIEFVKGRIVDRGSEIDAIFHALLAGQHAFMQSPPGTAKSLLADEIFKCFVGDEAHPVRYFKCQMSQGMFPDELFGPVSLKKLREEDKLLRRVGGFLPSANVAFLDEIFDAGPNILRGLLQILNERRFDRGAQRIKCPLEFAICTSNFLPDDAKLDAVRDRFLVQIHIAPVEAGESRVKMLTSFRDHFMRKRKETSRPTLLWSDFLKLRSRVRSAKIPRSVLTTYDELLSVYEGKTKRIESVRLTDRRRCHALTLASVAAVLDNRDKVEDSDLYETIYGLARVNDEPSVTAFADAVSQVLRTNAKIEIPSSDLEKEIDRHMEIEFDEDVKAVIASLQLVYDAVSRVPQVSAAIQPKLKMLLARIANALQGSDSLRQALLQMDRDAPTIQSGATRITSAAAISGLSATLLAGGK